jgi:hypothetical protein
MASSFDVLALYSVTARGTTRQCFGLDFRADIVKLCFGVAVFWVESGWFLLTRDVGYDAGPCRWVHTNSFSCVTHFVSHVGPVLFEGC